MAFDPRDYWNRLVSGDLGLETVGHKELGAYNRLAYRLRLAGLQRALRPLGLPRRETRVFEGGFGVGFYLRYWAELGVQHVAGVDLSKAAAERARREFPGYVLMEGDLAQPPPVQGQFDLCTAIDVLYHIVDDSRWRLALSNLAGLLAPGGYLVFTDKFPRAGVSSDPRFPHVRRRPLEWYQEALATHSISLLRILPVFVFMDDPIQNGPHPLLGRMSQLQWRIVSKTLRMLPDRTLAKQVVGLALGAVQYPFELATLRILRRSPNLEIVVARKE